MNVTWNTVNRRFSSMRDIHFAAAEDKNTAVNHTSGRDQVTISQEGRDRLEVLADKVENQLSAMTKEDFMDMLKQWKSENQPELEADPYRKVDPDGSIARKTYFESYLGQLTVWHLFPENIYVIGLTITTRTFRRRNDNGHIISFVQC